MAWVEFAEELPQRFDVATVAEELAGEGPAEVMGLRQARHVRNEASNDRIQIVHARRVPAASLSSEASERHRLPQRGVVDDG